MSRFPPVARFENPIAGKDVAETFQEDTVDVDHAGTIDNAGSVRLVNSGDSESVAYGTDWEQKSLASEYNRGVILDPSTELTSVDCHINSLQNGRDSAHLVRMSDGVELDSVTGPSEWFTLTGTMTAGETYGVYLNWTDQAYAVDNSLSFPVGGDLTDVIAGYDGGETRDRPFAIDEVQPTAADATVGDTVISWPQPQNVFRWDAATFRRTFDSETVQVDIQESADGGDTWSTIATDIGRGQDITADPSNQCRFRVHLERASTTNTPTLDAIYRRWVV